MRNKNYNLTDALSTVESELRSCRDQLERMEIERDNLKRQTALHLLEFERMKQVSYLCPYKSQDLFYSELNTKFINSQLRTKILLI